jgi:glycosyltransferase involved in cell wall biosynthesis
MKPDIWMISSSFYPHLGGAEQQALRLSQKLIERGWNVRVLTRRHNPRYLYLPPVFEKHQGVPVHRLFSLGPGKLGALTFILSSVVYLSVHGRNGIYHAHGVGAPATIAILASKLFGGKSLIKLRQEAKYYAQIIQTQYQRGYKYQIQAADYVITVNSSAKKELQTWGISDDRVQFLPNAIDVDKFFPEKREEKKRVRGDLLDGQLNKTLFLFIGRLAHQKGIDLLLSAWAALSSQIRQESALLIVGNGPEKSNLVAQSKQLGIASSAKFFGRRENVLDFYHAADIVVLPSRWEGLSNVMLEAMACGLPIICTEVGGAVEWIQSGKNGKLVPPEDVKALSGVLQWMWENEEKWAELGMNARETILRSLTMDVLVEKLEKVYLS